MTKPPVIYVVEVEHLPGKWRPVGLPPYERCKEAREACDVVRKHSKARVRVGRYTFDGLTTEGDRYREHRRNVRSLLSLHAYAYAQGRHAWQVHPQRTAERRLSHLSDGSGRRSL